jgi:hypothetical protein
MASMNELMIKIHNLMKQSLPYVFSLKELNSDLFQQYTFHISTSKPLNNSLCTWLCVCGLCMHTHARVCMCACACVHAHIWGGLDTFMVFDVKLSIPYKNTLECTNVTFSRPVWNALFCINFSCLTRPQKME